MNIKLTPIINYGRRSGFIQEVVYTTYDNNLLNMRSAACRFVSRATTAATAHHHQQPLRPCASGTPMIMRMPSVGQTQQQQRRSDSSSSSSSPAAVEFQHAKARDLFERITQKCRKEDIPLLANEMMNILGRTFRQNEFYYQGFGGRRVKGGGAGAGDDEAAAAPQEAAKTTVDLKLAGYDDKAKIKVIKEIRAITGLGLKEAKEMVESAPAVIQKEMKPEAAEELKKKLEEIGATIELV